MSKTYLLISFDDTGSMYSVRSQVRQKINSFVDEAFMAIEDLYIGIIRGTSKKSMRKYSEKGWEKRKKEREGYSEFYQKHCEIAKYRPCMECGSKLRGDVSEVCHIFEKSKYKSISTNDLNILYLCGHSSKHQCHNKFDSTFNITSQMLCFETAIDRYLHLKFLITEDGKKINFFEDYILSKDVTEPEVWLPVKGFENYYEVSSYGAVKSIRSGRILKSSTHKFGYKKVTLSIDNKQTYRLIHRLVGEKFVKNPNDYLIINHKDSNPSNNFYRNLEWCTSRQNVLHKFKNGVSYREDQKNYISRIYIEGKYYRLYCGKSEREAIELYNKALSDWNDYKIKPKPYINENKSSKYRGVSFNKQSNKWECYIHINRKKYNLGKYDSELEAYLIVEKAKIDYLKKGKLPK